MEVSRSAYEMANHRGSAKRGTFPAAVSVRYDNRARRIIIVLESGVEIAFSCKLAQGLESARPVDLAEAEISPSGLGIHFPKLDADIYLPALLEGILGSRRWMASEIGKLGGASTTVAKAAAARQNGKLGGRPKKRKTVAEA
jgi:hypothetical protein